MNSALRFVSVADIQVVTQAGAVLLAPETAGALVLAIAEGLSSNSLQLGATTVKLSELGEVTLESPTYGQPGAAVASLCELLDGLLRVCSTESPPLARVARRPVADVPSLQGALATALVPMNRAAARRALSRLARETLRELPQHGGALVPPPEKSTTATLSSPQAPKAALAPLPQEPALASRPLPQEPALAPRPLPQEPAVALLAAASASQALSPWPRGEGAAVHPALAPENPRPPPPFLESSDPPEVTSSLELPTPAWFPTFGEETLVEATAAPVEETSLPLALPGMLPEPPDASQPCAEELTRALPPAVQEALVGQETRLVQQARAHQEQLLLQAARVGAPLLPGSTEEALASGLAREGLLSPAQPTSAERPEAAVQTEASVPAESSVYREASVPAESSVHREASVPVESSVHREASVPVESSVHAQAPAPLELPRVSYVEEPSPSRGPRAEASQEAPVRLAPEERLSQLLDSYPYAVQPDPAMVSAELKLLAGLEPTPPPLPVEEQAAWGLSPREPVSAVCSPPAPAHALRRALSAGGRGEPRRPKAPRASLLFMVFCLFGGIAMTLGVWVLHPELFRGHEPTRSLPR